MNALLWILAVTAIGVAAHFLPLLIVMGINLLERSPQPSRRRVGYAPKNQEKPRPSENSQPD